MIGPDYLHRREIIVASLLFISPLSGAFPSSSISGNRRLQSGGIEAPSTPAIEGTRPPPPRLCPIKGRHTLGEDPHTSNAPPLSPHHALDAPFQAKAPPPVRRPSTASRPATTPSLSSPARTSPPLGRSSRAPERPEAMLR
jgi:hypothetical protein